MKNILYIFSVGIAIGLLALAGMIQIVRAETLIQGEPLVIDAEIVTWDEEHSPYILDQDVMVTGGGSLVIGPGVEVRDFSEHAHSIIASDGSTISLRGEPDRRVSVGGLAEIYARQGATIIMEHADLSGMTNAVRIDESRAIIASSTVSSSESSGIVAGSSGLSIWGSSITDNHEGIRIERSPGPFLMRSGDVVGIGGIGNALEDVPEGQSWTSVHGSIIEANTSGGAVSVDWVGADMSHNWWGSSEGPGVLHGANSVIGNVTYEPWLPERPVLFDVAPEDVTCCSSILFLPGLEASRLYRSETGIFGDRTNRLWEPNRNDDVRKLFLDETGSSTDSSIYVGDPVGEAYGLVDIYGLFMDFLDDTVGDGVIREWKSYGYDWRKPIAEVVAGTERRATSTDSLVATVRSMVARSDTGKVSIIAHSNGGLVAKYLVKTLADMGIEDIIDTVISVGVPYLGTPQAILGLLHGDGQSIGSGVILAQSVARQLGVDMPSAYSLLPSPGYFSRALGPTIAFAGTVGPDFKDASYPSGIDSYDMQESFILNETNTRNFDVSSPVSAPIDGNAMLMQAARTFHDLIDPFSWPATIAHWAIAGWGRLTAQGIEYSGKEQCSGIGEHRTCTVVPAYRSIDTSLGDGTVVVPSAMYDADGIIAVDLGRLSQDMDEDINHSNMLGTDAVQDPIHYILGHGGEMEDGLQDTLSRLPYVTFSEPDSSQEKTFLVVSTHSPVELHVYDEQGRHTGTTLPPPGLDTGDGDGLEEGLLTFYEKKIPGSDIKIQEGHSGDETYITIPDNENSIYAVEIYGTGVGTFDYMVERVSGGQVLDSTEYLGIPVTPLTVAKGSIRAGQIMDGDMPEPLSSAIIFAVDADGDGSFESMPVPGEYSDVVSFMRALRGTIIGLLGDSSRAKGIIRRLDRLEKLYTKNKLTRMTIVAERLKKRVVRKKPAQLATNDKEYIVAMIDRFISQLE